MSKIIIGADLVPTDTNVNMFIKGDVEALVGKDLLERLQAADYRIFNLEVPLTDTKDPIEKCGPNLIAPTATINGYKSIGTDILTLANNHILDQGHQGLVSTIELLDKNKIGHVGVGYSVEEALKPYIFNLDDKKIGIYACAEHEFSIITDFPNGGANPFDPLESPDHVAALKKECDYVIVLYHGGKEHYRYPSPNLQKVCRKLIEKGADLVICQHSHCIGCEEKFMHGTIVYGQGNFLFDHSKSEYWKTSLLVEVDSDFNITYIPIEKRKNTVRLAEPENAEKILQEFNERGQQILVEGFVEDKYTVFAEDMLTTYLVHASGMRRGLVYRVINKLSGYKFGKWLMRRRYKGKKVALRNYIECEAHRELWLYGLNTNK